MSSPNVLKPGKATKDCLRNPEQYLIPANVGTAAGLKLAAILLWKISYFWPQAGKKKALGGRRATVADTDWWAGVAGLSENQIERFIRKLKAQKLIWCGRCMWNNGDGSALTRAIILTARVQDGKLISTQQWGCDASGESLPGMPPVSMSKPASSLVETCKFASQNLQVCLSKPADSQETLQEDALENNVQEDGAGGTSALAPLATPNYSQKKSLIGEIEDKEDNTDLKTPLPSFQNTYSISFQKKNKKTEDDTAVDELEALWKQVYAEKYATPVAMGQWDRAALRLVLAQCSSWLDVAKFFVRTVVENWDACMSNCGVHFQYELSPERPLLSVIEKHFPSMWPWFLEEHCSEELQLAFLVKQMGDKAWAEEIWLKHHKQLPEGWLEGGVLSFRKQCFAWDSENFWVAAFGEPVSKLLSGKYQEIDWRDDCDHKKLLVAYSPQEQFDNLRRVLGEENARLVWSDAYGFPVASETPKKIAPPASPEPVQVEAVTPEPAPASTVIVEAPATSAVSEAIPNTGAPCADIIYTGEIAVSSTKTTARDFADFILGGGPEDQWLAEYGPIPENGWGMVDVLQRNREEAAKTKTKNKKPGPPKAAPHKKVNKNPVVNIPEAYPEPTDTELAEIEEKAMATLAKELEANSIDHIIASAQQYSVPQHSTVTPPPGDEGWLNFMLGGAADDKQSVKEAA